MDEGQPDGPLEFVGGVEDELAVGGGDDPRDCLADGLGEFFPAVADGEPRRQCASFAGESSGGGMGLDRCFGRLGCFVRMYTSM